MTLNLERLIENLSNRSSDELDSILDIRDSDPFDSEWVAINEKLNCKDRYPELKEIFMRVSSAVNQHEIASYIADDLDLIHRAKSDKLKSEFVEYLKKEYSEGRVPYNWTA